MMLDEAIARYHRRRADYQRAVLHAIVSGSSGPAKRALDAAVRDCMLAALQETRRRFSCASSGANLAWGFEVLDEVEADLKHRLLPEGSEGGKDESLQLVQATPGDRRPRVRATWAVQGLVWAGERGRWPKAPRYLP